jgi:hypothetical protein
MLTSSDASANAIGSATSTLPEHRSALFDGNAFAQAIDRATATLPERSAPLDGDRFAQEVTASVAATTG